MRHDKHRDVYVPSRPRSRLRSRLRRRRFHRRLRYRGCGRTLISIEPIYPDSSLADPLTVLTLFSRALSRVPPSHNYKSFYCSIYRTGTPILLYRYSLTDAPRRCEAHHTAHRSTAHRTPTDSTQHTTTKSTVHTKTHLSVAPVPHSRCGALHCTHMCCTHPLLCTRWSTNKPVSAPCEHCAELSSVRLPSPGVPSPESRLLFSGPFPSSFLTGRR